MVAVVVTELQKSTFLLEMMTLVSSVIIMGSDKLFIVGQKSFMYIMKRKGPRINLYGTPCFIVSQVAKSLGILAGLHPR